MRKRPPDRKNAILWVFVKMVTALFCNRVVGVSPLGRSGYKIGISRFEVFEEIGAFRPMGVLRHLGHPWDRWCAFGVYSVPGSSVCSPPAVPVCHVFSPCCCGSVSSSP